MKSFSQSGSGFLSCEAQGGDSSDPGEEGRSKCAPRARKQRRRRPLCIVMRRSQSEQIERGGGRASAFAAGLRARYEYQTLTTTRYTARHSRVGVGLSTNRKPFVVGAVAGTGAETVSSLGSIPGQLESYFIAERRSIDSSS